MKQLAACSIVIAVLTTSSVSAQDTIEVKKDEFAITVTIDGIFESKKTGEIKSGNRVVD